MKKIFKVFVLLVLGFILVSCDNNEIAVEKVINFDSNGGSQVYAIIHSSDLVGTLPEDPSKDGYTFAGWYLDDEAFQNPLDLSSFDLSELTGDIIVYAKWNINQYSISFDSNGGTDVAEITQDYNSLVSAPNDPEKEDFIFGGWYIDPEFTTLYQFDHIASNDITLYAKWQDSIFTFTLNENDEATITGITPDTIDTYLEVPATVSGYPVISVALGTFDNHTNIEILNLPNSIETLPMALLKNLSQLETLYIPFVGEDRNATGARAMLSYLFCDEEITSFIDVERRNLYITSHLTTVFVTDATTIPSMAFSGVSLDFVGLYEGLTTIEQWAFSSYNGIQSIYIPASVTNISPTAFMNNENFVSIYVSPDNPMYLSTIFDHALYNKDRTKIVMYPGGIPEVQFTIPEGITEIGDFAFFGSQLSRIVIPASVEVIGMNAFENSVHLISVTFESNSQLTSIAEGTFFGTNIIQIEIPSNVTTIGHYAFSNNRNLESVTFEMNSQITTIEDFAFEFCNSLGSIIIPLSVTTMGMEVFFEIREITIYVEATVKPEGWNSSWSSDGTVVWGYTND
ncbi:MAG: leucine-rich repeat protein [Firmicutes bacterium]|nr:leucine-rich repeat protein [Bacillota bacterium]